MKISYTPALNAQADALICPVLEDQKTLSSYDVNLRKYIKNLKEAKLFSGKSGEIETVTTGSKKLPKKIYFVGLGKKSKLESNDVRDGIAGATKKIMNKLNNKVAFYLVEDLEKYVQEIVEGLMLVNYTPAKYKTGKDAKKAEENLFTGLQFVGKSFPKAVKDKIENVSKMVESVNMVRDLVNGPPNIVTVEYFAKEAKKIAKQNKYSVTVLEKPALEKMGMGSFLSVNKGSGDQSAKLVVLDYNPEGLKKSDANEPILIIGKGVIFDSGGYNLKPTKYIEDMQQDMAGGAVVLGVFKVLKDLGIKKRVVGMVPLTENLIDSKAQKPSDIVTTYSGKTVEVRNTDAEGRMILADALSYGIEKYKPKYTIDLATLTGACLYALGTDYAGVMGNDEKLKDDLINAGKETDELLWELPLHKDYKKTIKGKLADLRNIDNGSNYLAGTSKAAAFLEEFVGKAKWAHLDIAGTAYVEKPRTFDQPMATGYGVRLLVNYLQNL
ncbi:leucyl aminopeptidase [Patescibacteria group bacterium]